MEIKEYDFIFSLGEACFTATLLKGYFLRTQSSPFDWVYGVTFEEKMQIFLNDFENYFNKEDLEFFCEPSEDNKNFTIYKNKRTGLIFNHDFSFSPSKPRFEDLYPSVKRKHDKRIKRTLETIRNSKNVLILYVDLPETKRGVHDWELLESYMERVNKKYPDTHIDILYIKDNASLQNYEVIYSRVGDYILVAECYIKPEDPIATPHGCNSKNTSTAISYIKLKNEAFLQGRKEVDMQGVLMLFRGLLKDKSVKKN